MDQEEVMTASMVVMQDLKTVATTAAAGLSENCCLTSFEGVNIHAGDCSASWGDKQGKLSLHVFEDFGSRPGLLLYGAIDLVSDTRKQRILASGL